MMTIVTLITTVIVPLVLIETTNFDLLKRQSIANVHILRYECVGGKGR
jgi:hypothetical protein